MTRDEIGRLLMYKKYYWVKNFQLFVIKYYL